MKILLCTQRIESIGLQIDFSQGIGYLAAVLRIHGHSAQVLETNADAIDCDSIKKVFREDDFEIIGLGGLSAAFSSVEWMMEYIREERPETPIILGGGLLTAAPELIFNHLLPDFGVIGEGERTIVELVKCLEEGTPPDGVNGLIYHRDGPFRTERREPIPDLDKLPYPAWDDFDIERMVHNASHALVGRRRMTVLSSRSCPFLCTFCFHTIGNAYRKRSPMSVVGEMKELIKRYRIDHFAFGDELFIYNPKWITEFCQMVIDEKFGITWESTGKPGYTNADALPLMKESGCVLISHGFETGSDKVLISMKKKTTVAAAKKTINLYRNAGIHTSGGIVVGDPAETRETFRETIDFIKEMDLLVIWMGFITPYPGTYLYREAIKRGLITDEIEFHRNIPNTTNLSINFTDIPDTELIKMREDGLKEVREHLISVADRSFNRAHIMDRNTSSVFMNCKGCKTEFHSVVTTSSLRWNEVSCPVCHYGYLVNPYRIPHIREKIDSLEEKTSKLTGKIFITPIGEHTRIAMGYIGCKIAGVLDSDNIRAKAEFEGLPCYHRSPETIKKLKPDWAVVTSEIGLTDVIIEDLVKCNVKKERIIAYGIS